MDDLPVVGTCPLGGECRKIVDNEIHQCAWYIKVVGKDPQSEKELEEWKCAMVWIPIMLIETSQTNRGQTEAISSFRDEMTKNQEIFNGIMIQGIQQKQLKDK